MTPRILWNAKDDPRVPSGYGVIGKHLLPRLADRYGRKNVLIYAPVYNRDGLGEFEGMVVLPGTKTEFEEPILLEHYRRYECTMLLQVGDWVQLRHVPEWALNDEILWVQWAPMDLLNVPQAMKDLLRIPIQIVPFTQYAHKRFVDMDLENVADPIWIGLDSSIWQPRDRSTMPKIMKSVGFTEDTFNVLIVQANQRRKYLQETFHGIAIFRRDNPDVKVRVYLHSAERAGETPLEPSLQEAGIHDVTKVAEEYTFVTGGFTEETLAMVFACADVVMDVAFEGFGLSLTQGQACGVPVIGLADGPGPELIKRGMLVEPSWIDYSMPYGRPVASPPAIAAALQQLYRSGTRRIDPPPEVALWDWDHVADQWFEIIDEVEKMRDRYTLTIPKPSPELKERAGRIKEISP